MDCSKSEKETTHSFIFVAIVLEASIAHSVYIQTNIHSHLRPIHPLMVLSQQPDIVYIGS